MTDLNVEVNDVDLADEGWVADTVNVVATRDDDFHVNVRITDEGLILDSYDTNGELVGTLGMMWDEWADYMSVANSERARAVLSLFSDKVNAATLT